MSYLQQMQSVGAIQPQRVQERYGISAESFNDIQRRLDTNAPRRETPQTTIEVQRVQRTEDQNQMTPAQTELLMKMKEALEYQMVQFNRFRDLTEQKFASLSKDLLDVTMQLKEAREVVSKQRDRDDVQAARQRLQEYQKGDRPPVDQPIDRNGVAPSKVQLANIFNCAGKKF